MNRASAFVVSTSQPNISGQHFLMELLRARRFRHVETGQTQTVDTKLEEHCSLKYYCMVACRFSCTGNKGSNGLIQRRSTHRLLWQSDSMQIAALTLSLSRTWALSPDSETHTHTQYLESFWTVYLTCCIWMLHVSTQTVSTEKRNQTPSPETPNRHVSVQKPVVKKVSTNDYFHSGSIC